MTASSVSRFDFLISVTKNSIVF